MRNINFPALLRPWAWHGTVGCCCRLVGSLVRWRRTIVTTSTTTLLLWMNKICRTILKSETVARIDVYNFKRIVYVVWTENVAFVRVFSFSSVPLQGSSNNKPNFIHWIEMHGFHVLSGWFQTLVYSSGGKGSINVLLTLGLGLAR